MPVFDEPNIRDARQAMIAVLLAVSDHLPAQLESAVRFAASSDDAKGNESARVALWESIAGRDMEQTPEVLLTRLVICVLHPDARQDETQDVLEFFMHTFRQARLPEDSLQPVVSLGSYYAA